MLICKFQSDYAQTEAYSEPSQASEMDLFPKIVQDRKTLTILAKVPCWALYASVLYYLVFQGLSKNC